MTIFAHQSKSNEHFTDTAVVERARAVLRPSIDLDPATCELANRSVRARRIFTATTNGFTKRWFGNVFLNPPGGTCDAKDGVTLVKKKGGGWVRPSGLAPIVGATSSQRAWWFKLAREHAERRVEAAIFVCFSIELLQTTQADNGSNAPIPFDFPICFPRKRLDYYKPTKAGIVPGGAPPHASCIVFLPPYERDDDFATSALDRFEREFESLGRVVLPS